MKDKDKIMLQKMDNYIQEILQYTKEMSFDDFHNDQKTINASAFLIGQIGELVIRISDETKKDNFHIPWKDVKGMRNCIIHDYENVDLTVLWYTIEKDLPILSNELNKLLAK